MVLAPSTPTPAPAPPPSSGGVLKNGSPGSAVTDLQTKLHDLGFLNGAIDVAG